MKNVSTQHLDLNITKPNTTLNEEPHPIKLITHYFSVPETPHPRNQQKIKPNQPQIPETPEQLNTDTKNCQTPATRNEQIKSQGNQTNPLNKNLNTQDDEIIYELMDTTKTQVSDNE